LAVEFQAACGRVPCDTPSPASGAESIHMNRALVRRVQRLEAAKRTLYRPPCEVIYLDQHGRPNRAVPARPDGLPTRVIFLPAIVPLKEDEIQDMALPQPNRRG